jgi:hypothetical protein
MHLQDSEVVALDNSTKLLKFAAESPKDVPPTVIADLLAAWEAAENKAWNPTIATAFWVAYGKLCDLIKPVTMDTLAMGESRAAPSTGWRRYLPYRSASRAQAKASCYLALLLLLVGFSVAFGFIASATTKLSDDIQKLIDEGNKLVPEITLLISNTKMDLEKAGKQGDVLQFPLDDPSMDDDARKNVQELRAKLQELYKVADTLDFRVSGISQVTRFAPLGDYQQGDLSRLPMLSAGYDNLTSYFQTRRKVVMAQQKVFLLNGIYNALVPLLLGAVGACTYVLRLTSDQIKDSTFSPSSPIRHVVRIALGSLAGLIVGLGGFNNELNLSSAAISFLSGYAIEPVFSTLDSIAEKFRRA